VTATAAALPADRLELGGPGIVVAVVLHLVLLAVVGIEAA
jgi:hypothetical protein